MNNIDEAIDLMVTGLRGQTDFGLRWTMSGLYEGVGMVDTFEIGAREDTDWWEVLPEMVRPEIEEFVATREARFGQPLVGISITSALLMAEFNREAKQTEYTLHFTVMARFGDKDAPAGEWKTERD